MATSIRTKAEADRDAQKIVNTWTCGAAAVGWIPGSMLVLAGMDAKVVHDVAKAYQVPTYCVEDVAAAVGASVTGKIIAGELLTLFPGLGWALKSVVAASITKALGTTLIAYFRDRTQLA